MRLNMQVLVPNPGKIQVRRESETECSVRPNLNIKQTGLLLVALPVVFGILFVVIPSLYLAEEAKRYQTFQETKRFVQMLIGTHTTYSRLLFVYFYAPRDTSIRANQIAGIERQIREKANFESYNKKLNLGPELNDFVKDAKLLGSTTEAFLEQMKASIHKPMPFGKQHLYETGLTVLPLAADMGNFQEKLVDLYTRLNQEEPARLRARNELFLLVVCGLTAGAAISFSAVWFFTRNIVRRLNKTAETARLIAVGQYVDPPEKVSDEIGELEQQIYDASIMVSETRKRESAILNGASHLICTIDSRLRISLVGDVCQKLWGYTPDELLGRSILTIVDQVSLDTTRDCFEKLQSQQDSEVELEARVCLRDGSFIDTMWTVNWSASKRSYYCVVRDVTELRLIEQRRQYLLSMAGHDLRAPLTAIGVYFNLIAEGAKGPISEQMAGEIRQMERTLLRVIDFVNQLLDLEKLEAGAGPLNLGAVSASDVCESARESLNFLCDQREVTIGEPSGAALVNGDEILVEKAVTNLLSSAVKLAPPSSLLRLVVSTESCMGFIRVDVPDVSIAVDDSEQIFDKQRLSSPVGRDIGLGLALVKAVADMHEGQVGIDSQSKNLSLWFALPLCDDTEHDA